MEQRIVITESQTEINSWIEGGWKVISITPLVPNGGYTTKGSLCFLLEKSK